MNIVEMVWACSSYPYVVIAHPTNTGVDYLEKIKMEGECRHISVRDTVWFDFVKLALMFDWQPEGALLRDEGGYKYRFLEAELNVEDSYHPYKLAEFKMVTETDAAAWADALDDALEELQTGKLELTFTTGPIILGENMSSQAYVNTNSPASLSKLREFIAFLRKGPFAFYYDD